MNPYMLLPWIKVQPPTKSRHPLQAESKTSNADELVSIWAYRSVARIEALAVGAIESYRHWRTRRTAVRELRALDDRLLRDIGINRGDIENAVDGLLSRPSPADSGSGCRERQTAISSGPHAKAANDNRSGLAA